MRAKKSKDVLSFVSAYVQEPMGVEIKANGKRYYAERIYGYYYKHERQVSTDITSEPITEATEYLVNQNGYGGIPVFTEIIGGTACAFSGEYDKTGEKIYAGDILLSDDSVEIHCLQSVAGTYFVKKFKDENGKTRAERFDRRFVSAFPIVGNVFEVGDKK